ncbi:MAG: hypothetical protein IJZ64_00070 [Ruminococcus sp.]|nr:hypothetical protein [Ruminococcus sp.]
MVIKSDKSLYDILLLKSEIKTLNKKIEQEEKNDNCILANYYKAKKAESEKKIIAFEEFVFTLPIEMREIARMRYMEGYSWAKICIQSHISQATSTRWNKKIIERWGAWQDQEKK